jgi:hypothetical protein
MPAVDSITFISVNRRDPDLFARAEREVAPRTSAIEGFREFPVVQAAPNHFILIITGDSPAVPAGNAARCATQP